MYYLKIQGKKRRPEGVSLTEIVNAYSDSFVFSLVRLQEELIELNRRYGYAK